MVVFDRKNPSPNLSKRFWSRGWWIRADRICLISLPSLFCNFMHLSKDFQVVHHDRLAVLIYIFNFELCWILFTSETYWMGSGNWMCGSDGMLHWCYIDKRRWPVQRGTSSINRTQNDITALPPWATRLRVGPCALFYCTIKLRQGSINSWRIFFTFAVLQATSGSWRHVQVPVHVSMGSFGLLL